MDQRQSASETAGLARSGANLPLKWRVLSVFALIFASFSCIRFLNTVASLILVGVSFPSSDLNVFVIAVGLATASFYITFLGSLPFAVAGLVMVRKTKKEACKAGISSKLISFASAFSVVGLVLVCIHSAVILTAIFLIFPI